jgi:hypothetical protein
LVLWIYEIREKMNMKNTTTRIPFIGSKNECEKEVDLLKKQGIKATVRALSPKEHSFVKKLQFSKSDRDSHEFMRYAVLVMNKRR